VPADFQAGGFTGVRQEVNMGKKALLLAVLIATFALVAVPLYTPATANEKSEKHDQSAKESAKDKAPEGAAKQQEKIDAAERVLTESVTAPDKGIPKNLLAKAECIGVFPGLKKGAFVVGGEFGRGVFTCRGEDGKMGAPAFFNLGGPSFGWQFGGEEADLVLLIMNKAGVEHLLKSKFTIGAEAAAAAGPVGRTTTAATDAQLHAQILSWSRSRGLFVGASVDGAVVDFNDGWSKEYYGKEVKARQILVEHAVAVPNGASSFVRTASEYSKRTSPPAGQ
jgi:lipid-binding SYLF domain-containing protein